MPKQSTKRRDLGQRFASELSAVRPPGLGTRFLPWLGGSGAILCDSCACLAWGRFKGTKKRRATGQHKGMQTGRHSASQPDTLLLHAVYNGFHFLAPEKTSRTIAHAVQIESRALAAPLRLASVPPRPAPPRHCAPPCAAVPGRASLCPAPPLGVSGFGFDKLLWCNFNPMDIRHQI